MGIEQTRPEPEKPGYDREKVQNFMTGYRNRLGDLSRALTFLPRVDEDGNSDCPFAENLYAEKEEAVPFVQRLVASLAEDYLPEIRAAIKAEAQNLAVMEEKVKEVGLEAAVVELDLGVGGQAAHLGRLREEKQRMEEELARGQKLLAESKEKKWPKGDPQQSVAAMPMPGMNNKPAELPFPPDLLIPPPMLTADEILSSTPPTVVPLPEPGGNSVARRVTQPPRDPLPEVSRLPPIPAAPPLGALDGMLAGGPVGPVLPLPPAGASGDLDWLLRGRGGPRGPRL